MTCLQATLFGNSHRHLGIISNDTIHANIDEFVDSDGMVDGVWNDSHSEVVGTINNLLGDKWHIVWGVWRSGAWGPMGWSDARAADRLGGSDPVTVEVAVEVEAQPWEGTISRGNDLTGANEANDGSFRPLHLDGGDGWPIKRLDDGLIHETLLFEEWNDIVDVLFTWQELLWSCWAKLKLEVDDCFLVLVAVDKIKELLKGRDVGDGVD